MKDQKSIQIKIRSRSKIGLDKINLFQKFIWYLSRSKIDLDQKITSSNIYPYEKVI
jgi:hypothetical protein